MMEMYPAKHLDSPASLAATGQQDVSWSSWVGFLERFLEEMLNQPGTPCLPFLFILLETQMYWLEFHWPSKQHGVMLTL